MEVSPHRLFCDTLAACYEWVSERAQKTDKIHDASDITRLALCLYLVQKGARPGWKVDMTREDATRLVTLLKSNVTVVWRSAASIEVFITRVEFIYESYNPAGNVFPDAVAYDAAGHLTWVCRAGHTEIDLWSEPIPNEAKYDAIEAQQRVFREALAPLGYTSHIRVE